MADSNHINNLPDGLLLEIFTYLPLIDRKTASQVCRLWDQEAFSARLMTSVRLRISCTMLNSKARSLELLRNSSRPYRNIMITLCGSGACNDIQYEFIVTVLDLFGKSIESFTMIRGCSAAQFKDFVVRMPGLKHVTAYVTEPDKRPVESLVFPVLGKLREVDLEINNDDVLESGQLDVLGMAPNVTQLGITFDKCDEPVQVIDLLEVCAEQLTSLDLFVPHDRIPIDELQLGKLEVLKLRGRAFSYDNNKLYLLFKGLPALKEVHLDFVVTESALRIVCSNCPKLEKLDIKTDILQEKSFKCLETLSNLQVLIVNFINTSMIVGCKPLTSIKEMQIHVDDTYLNNHDYAEQMYRVFPNVRSMKIFFRGFRTKIIDEVFVRQICRTFVNLRKLTVSGEYCLYATVRGFDSPNDLGNVEEFIFIKTDFSIGPSSYTNRIKRLIFDHVNAIDIDVYSIDKFFPKLQYLEFVSCKEIKPDVIVKLRETFPRCVIHYVHLEKRWMY
ncbi:AAEL005005-PA [Aedes aegypti]|uniref:AAEL005005-PA n=1 Tax=Aedes aegypti TaxID=7159 RepID=Q17BC3_AEDAE|nr:AAEL005005-PA [Aedes aegypti]